MKVVICLILLGITISQALRNCIFCKLTNDDSYDDECDSYICPKEDARCIKIVTHHTNMSYVTRTCGDANACGGNGEVDIASSPVQPGNGTMYCCDENGCNAGDRPRGHSAMWTLLILLVSLTACA